MIDTAQVKSVIDQYAKHDWVLRRALLSPPSIAVFESSIEAQNVDLRRVETSANEALWFSRRSLPDREAWELRRLSGSPFALVVVIEDSLPEEEREALLSDTERRMFDGSHPEPMSH